MEIKRKKSTGGSLELDDIRLGWYPDMYFCILAIWRKGYKVNPEGKVWDVEGAWQIIGKISIFVFNNYSLVKSPKEGYRVRSNGNNNECKEKLGLCFSLSFAT